MVVGTPAVFQFSVFTVVVVVVAGVLPLVLLKPFCGRIVTIVLPFDAVVSSGCSPTVVVSTLFGSGDTVTSVVTRCGIVSASFPDSISVADVDLVLILSTTLVTVLVEVLGVVLRGVSDEVVEGPSRSRAVVVDSFTVSGRVALVPTTAVVRSSE